MGSPSGRRLGAARLKIPGRYLEAFASGRPFAPLGDALPETSLLKNCARVGWDPFSGYGVCPTNAPGGGPARGTRDSGGLDDPSSPASCRDRAPRGPTLSLGQMGRKGERLIVSQQVAAGSVRDYGGLRGGRRRLRCALRCTRLFPS